MKKKKPTPEFWAVAMLNVLALIYPIKLFLVRANSVDENLFASCVLVGCLFLLVVVDAVSIVIADSVGTGKR